MPLSLHLFLRGKELYGLDRGLGASVTDCVLALFDEFRENATVFGKLRVAAFFCDSSVFEDDDSVALIECLCISARYHFCSVWELGLDVLEDTAFVGLGHEASGLVEEDDCRFEEE